MPAITKVSVTVQTGAGGAAGTDGWVYLGICGREFRVARPDINDFQPGRQDEYVFGDGGNVEDKRSNDPTRPRLHTDWANDFPVYLRFQPLSDNDNWLLENVRVTINGAESPFWKAGVFRGVVETEDRIWLGLRSGLLVNLSRDSSLP
ncbi:hypothetical protein [Actinoplanes utahensis]|uniref:hypothetical protein n=1 Tax=Actinoplanes utahensis TaxID=1869 RepID=UPI001269D851|nr:hypothetical protein [Actinoplanes utahensis]